MNSRHVGPAHGAHEGGHARRIPRADSLSSRLTVAAVASLLGLLAVGQLRAQSGAPGLAALSATDLSQLIANLTTGKSVQGKPASPFLLQMLEAGGLIPFLKTGAFPGTATR